MDSKRSWTAALVIIGDELLSGRTQDKNVIQVASWLNDQGIRLEEVRIVPDRSGTIARTVNELRTQHNYVLTTGGLGPTHDDITIDAIAEAFTVPVSVHPAACAMLEKFYGIPPGGLDDAQRRMARIPQGAALILNSLSGAPGLQIENVFVLAGVPDVAADMLRSLVGKLDGGKPIVSVTVGARAHESDVAQMLRDTQEAHIGTAIGSYPFFDGRRYGANFVVRSEKGDLARAAAQDLSRRLAIAGFEPVEGGI